MLNDLKRTLTMLEKALDRLIRHNYYNRKQCPEIITVIEETINNIRIWIQHREILGNLKNFYSRVCSFIENLEVLIAQLWDIIHPKAGKKKLKKERRIQEQNKIINSINAMLGNIAQKLKDLKIKDGLVVNALLSPPIKKPAKIIV